MKTWRVVFLIIAGIVFLLAVFLAIFTSKVKAHSDPWTNISFNPPSYHFSWNNIFGWADFHETHSIIVNDQKLTGYASSSVGDISLDCNQTAYGGSNVCEQTNNYGVKNDGSGFLSGYGWNQTIGWISFNCDQTAYGGLNVCAQSNNYRVKIDTATGDFNGYAWNQIVGWVSFNCAPDGNCAASDYKVNTDWRSIAAAGFLESSIFDTNAGGGAILNSVIWQGSQPVGTCVKFQIAVSNDPNPSFWSYNGPGQDNNQYFGNSCFGPNVTIPITGGDRTWVNNQRYLRYKVFLNSNTERSFSPKIEDIILNWSK